MQHLKFSVFISIIFLAPLILLPGIRETIPAVFLNPESVEPFFVTVTYLGLGGFIISTILIWLTLTLASRKNPIAKILSYIFTLPMLTLIYFIAIEIPSTIKALGDPSSEAGLGLIISLPFAILSLGLTFAYYYLVQDKMKLVWKSSG